MGPRAALSYHLPSLFAASRREYRNFSRGVLCFVAVADEMSQTKPKAAQTTTTLTFYFFLPLQLLLLQYVSLTMVSSAAVTAVSDHSAGPLSGEGTSADTRKVISIRTLMNQSTIYRRHEERRAKTIRLRGDTRPAFLRVISLLPGLHIIVPRYDPDAAEPNPKFPESVNENHKTSSAIAIGDYSEETVWEDYHHATKATTNAWQSSLQAMFATGTAATAANYFWGIPATTHLRQPLSHPHLLPTATSAVNPFANHNSRAGNRGSSQGRSMYQMLFQHQRHPAVATSRTLPIVAASSSMAALFATKVYLEELEAQESNHIFTSAIAGLMSGLVHRVVSATQPQVVPFPKFLGQQMVGATLYFGVYDALVVRQQNGELRKNEQQSPNLLQVAGAGAVAGGLYAAVTCTMLQSSMTLSSILRAAPTHALLWCSYESMRYHCSSGHDHSA